MTEFRNSDTVPRQMEDKEQLKGDASAIRTAIERKVEKLIATPFGRLVIEKHGPQLYVEETDKTKMILIAK